MLFYSAHLGGRVMPILSDTSKQASESMLGSLQGYAWNLCVLTILLTPWPPAYHLIIPSHFPVSLIFVPLHGCWLGGHGGRHGPLLP